MGTFKVVRKKSFLKFWFLTDEREKGKLRFKIKFKSSKLNRSIIRTHDEGLEVLGFW